MKKPEHTMRAIKGAIKKKKGKREAGDMIEWLRNKKGRLTGFKGLI